MLEGKIIAVTGSSGFIGCALVRKLKEANSEVLELDIKNGVDVTTWSQLETIKEVDIVYHLAALTFIPQAYKEPRKFYQTNINSAVNALELARVHSAKMVFASSYVYGKAEYLPIDEKHPVVSVNPYAGSKIMCEQLCQNYCKDFGVPTVILRPFNVFGPGQDKRFLIPSIISQATKGKVTLHDPEPKRDFLYIDDMVKAYLKAAEFDATDLEVFNVGSGVSHSVREIVGKICSLFDSNIEVNFTGNTRKNEIPDTVANISKAKDLLKWEPLVTFEQGLRDLIEDVNG